MEGRAWTFGGVGSKGSIWYRVNVSGGYNDNKNKKNIIKEGKQKIYIYKDKDIWMYIDICYPDSIHMCSQCPMVTKKENHKTRIYNGEYINQYEVHSIGLAM